MKNVEQKKVPVKPQKLKKVSKSCKINVFGKISWERTNKNKNKLPAIYIPINYGNIVELARYECEYGQMLM